MSQIDLQQSSFFHAWAHQKKILTGLDEAHLSKALQVKYSEAAVLFTRFCKSHIACCFSTWTAPWSFPFVHSHFFHQICEPPVLTSGEDQVCPISVFNSDWHHHLPHQILWPFSLLIKESRTDTKTNPRFSGTIINHETGAVLCNALCNVLCYALCISCAPRD